MRCDHIPKSIFRFIISKNLWASLILILFSGLGFFIQILLSWIHGNNDALLIFLRGEFLVIMISLLFTSMLSVEFSVNSVKWTGWKIIFKYLAMFIGLILSIIYALFKTAEESFVMNNMIVIIVLNLVLLAVTIWSLIQSQLTLVISHEVDSSEKQKDKFENQADEFLDGASNE